MAGQDGGHQQAGRPQAWDRSATRARDSRGARAEPRSGWRRCAGVHPGRRPSAWSRAAVVSGRARGSGGGAALLLVPGRRRGSSSCGTVEVDRRLRRRVACAGPSCGVRRPGGGSCRVRCSCCEPPGRPQPGAAGARVVGHLLLAGDAVAGRPTRASRGCAAADAHGELGRADAALPLARHEALDDAVLERVVADDAEPPVRREQVEAGLERGRQRLQLAVDLDAQRLEDPRGGMDAPPPGVRAGAAAAMTLGQLRRRLDGPARALASRWRARCAGHAAPRRGGGRGCARAASS